MVFKMKHQTNKLRVNCLSRKINKVRWFPKSSSVFVTGSYNDENNKITVWQCTPLLNPNDGEIRSYEGEPEICEISTCGFPGDVTDLKVVSEDTILASSSNGSVSVFNLVFNFSNKHLKLVQRWNSIHKFQNGPVATTGISVKGNSVASVDEAGYLCFFNLSTKQKMDEIKVEDLSTLTCVTHLRHNEIIAGNSLGSMRLFDLRDPSSKSSCLLSLAYGQGEVTSMNVHPTQPHILASGYGDGSVCMWDMRQKKSMSLLRAHADQITELLFHPNNPDFLFTCSYEYLLQWDSSKLNKKNLPIYTSSLEPEEIHEYATGNSWLNCEAQNHKLEVTNISPQTWSPINSLDITDTTLVWVNDSETLFFYDL